MAHIHNDDNQHDQTASGYIIRLDVPNAPAIMLHEHRLLKFWLHYGGHVELDENPWQAVIRELREEAGYEISQLRILQPHTRPRGLNDPGAIFHPTPALTLTHRFGTTKHFHTDTVFAFVANEPPKHALDDDESSVTQCFNREEIASLPKDAIPDNARSGMLYVLDNILGAWEECDPSDWPVTIG